VEDQFQRGFRCAHPHNYNQEWLTIAVADRHQHHDLTPTHSNRPAAGLTPDDFMPCAPPLINASTAPPQMKKRATIIVVLIILLTIIGFERIRRGFHFLISDDRVARTRRADEITNSRDTKLKESSIEEQDSSRIASHFQDRRYDDTITTASITNRGGSQSVQVSIAGEISPMHFIRASFILGSTAPSKEQIDRLREAVDAVGEALRPGAIIFDADGFSTSEVPVLLFARGEFDLTAQVKLIYDTLGKASH
jgi:hypothetical protein